MGNTRKGDNEIISLTYIADDFHNLYKFIKNIK